MALRNWTVENKGVSAQEWIQILNDYLTTYYEELDPAGEYDDMDRIYRQQEVEELGESALKSGYKSLMTI